jgi:hypothetical protein
MGYEAVMLHPAQTSREVTPSSDMEVPSDIIAHCTQVGIKGSNKRPSSTLLGLQTTTRKTVIGCTLSAAVPLEPLPDHISTAVLDLELLLTSGQLIKSDSSFELVLIISLSATV